MITQNELYDMGHVFTLIRSDIESSVNINILKKLIEAVNDKEYSFQPNNIRSRLALIIEPNDLKWEFVFINNYYTQPTEIIKNPNVNQCLIDVTNLLKDLLINNKYNQAYDLTDILQSMLQIIAGFNGFITKSFWNTVIKKYRKNWDKDFLIKYEKILKTTDKFKRRRY
jgi:hypothetical protein